MFLKSSRQTYIDFDYEGDFFSGKPWTTAFQSALIVPSICFGFKKDTRVT